MNIFIPRLYFNQMSDTYIYLNPFSLSKSTEYHVHLGDNDLYKSEDSEQNIKVKRIQLHPKYNQTLLINDIVLLELEKPAILNKQVGLVCLPPQDYDVSVRSNCYITGKSEFPFPPRFCSRSRNKKPRVIPSHEKPSPSEAEHRFRLWLCRSRPN